MTLDTPEADIVLRPRPRLVVDNIARWPAPARSASDVLREIREECLPRVRARQRRTRRIRMLVRAWWWTWRVLVVGGVFGSAVASVWTWFR